MGDLVRHKVNHQVGTVTDIRDKKATVRIGKLPFQVGIEEWVVVRKKSMKEGSNGKPQKAGKKHDDD